MDLNCQYAFVTSSRQVLLDYCQGIAAIDFVAENSAFGRGSIRNLLVHIGNTYEFWIGKHALNIQTDIRAYNTINDALQARAYLLSIDSLMARFFDLYSDRLLNDLVISNNGQKITASPLKLFSHVITHEFHHKGQILSLSRHLGYIPVDTDIIR
ncbi:MAG TPA: DinB family protein [Flavisolibacter sp.]|jgi:uncharacterized damage-inducible protein DinB|nr:DinB family protein [Flavisolibacter sp.]